MNDTPPQIEIINKLYSSKKYREAYELAKAEINKRNLKRYTTYKSLSKIMKDCQLKNLELADDANMKKFVSVITINLNNLAGIKRTIESVINQTVRERIQFVIIDGYSGDGTLNYLKEISSKIDVCVYDKDGGIYDAMNRGIEFACSEYCIFMNSGDCFDSNNVIEKIIKNISELDYRPNAIYSNTRMSNGAIWVAHDLNDFWKGMNFSHQSVLIDTQSLKKEPYDSSKEIVADFLQLYKLYVTRGSFYFINMVIGHIDEVGVSSDFYGRTLERWMGVRGIENPNVKKEDVDNFYRSYLSTKDGKYSPSFKFEANEAQLNIIDNAQERIIFIISMPRSGSTLLQHILAQSNNIHTVSEPWLMLPILASYDNELINAKYNQNLNISAKNEFIKNTNNPDFIKQAQQVYANSVYSSIIGESDKRYFLDKTPRYIYIVQRLKEIYPKSKYIILTRNPAAVISSYAHTWYKSSFKSLMNAPASRYDIKKGFVKLAEFIKSDFKNKIIVRYEDLVISPEKTALEIFKYLRIGFNKSYINYNSNKKDLPKFKFGDPNTVYKKSRPDSTHKDKWIKDTHKNGTQQDLVDILNLIPDKTITDLGYSKTLIMQQLEVNTLASLFSEIEAKFGSNNERLDFLRKNYNTSLKKTLGILITSFNNKDSIILALKSVTQQSKKPDLILVTDDCSTDGSQEIIKKFIEENPEYNIRLNAREKNLGVSKNRDLAIREMEADYICTLDGDDVFYPGKLEAEYLLMQDSCETVAFSNILVRTKNEMLIQDTSNYNQRTKEKMISMLITRESPVPRDMMFPKTLFEKANGFDHKMTAYEDWALKCRLMALSPTASWMATGLIGTIYDRRDPGLSNLSPIEHCYTQLIALARNIEYIRNDHLALSKAIKKLSTLLKDDASKRLSKFADDLLSTKGITEETLEKLSSLYTNHLESHPDDMTPEFYFQQVSSLSITK